MLLRINPFSTNVPFTDKQGSWFLRKWNIDWKWVNVIMYKLAIYPPPPTSVSYIWITTLWLQPLFGSDLRL